VASGRWILFIYPLTGQPGADIPEGWDAIPGARGCSQEACGFRDNMSGLRAGGIEQVVALSSDRHEYQTALVNKFHLPYAMLSDENHELAAALNLPLFEGDGKTLYRRITLVADGTRIEHVFYPIFPPNTHAEEVVQWLSDRAGNVPR
jgi:peroxiredoxin